MGEVKIPPMRRHSLWKLYGFENFIHLSYLIPKVFLRLQMFKAPKLVLRFFVGKFDFQNTFLTE